MNWGLYLAFLLMMTTNLSADVQKLRPERLQSGDEWHFHSDGSILKGRRWLPVSGEPKAVLVPVHGTQTHSGWFGALAFELVREGWAVYAPDRRGSGLNLRLDASRQPLPVDVPHWHEWVYDLDAAVGQIKAERHFGSQRPPIYLLGSSWGGSLATVYMASRSSGTKDVPKTRHAASLSGLVLNVPAGLASRLPGLGKKAEVLMVGGPLLWLGRGLPWLRDAATGIGLPAASYSSVDAVQKLIGDVDCAYPENERPLGLGDKDFRIIHRATYRFFFQSSAMRRVAQNQLQQWRTHPGLSPLVLGLLSTVDDIADNPALKRLLPESTTVTLPDTDHSVQLLHPDQMADAICRWHDNR